VSQAEFAADLPRILDAMDQPTIDGINTWFVSKAAHEAGLKVAVSGLGGDELFGGYPSFQSLPRWTRLLWLPGLIPGLAALSEQIQDLFAPLFPGLNPKAAGMLRYGGSYAGAYLLKRGLFLPRELPRIMDPDLVRDGLRRLAPLDLIRAALTTSSGRGAPRRDPTRSAFGKVATLESSLYMRNQLLRDTDWSSMAHSLEVRVPLVDVWLLRAVARLVVRVKPPNQKWLLAQAPQPSLPESVTRRAKSGFTTPAADWQRQLQTPSPTRECRSGLRHSGPWARRWACAVASDF
jgi:asparagine synthase (glutamine-hydrolysing)